MVELVLCGCAGIEEDARAVAHAGACLDAVLPLLLLATLLQCLLGVCRGRSANPHPPPAWLAAAAAESPVCATAVAIATAAADSAAQEGHAAVADQLRAAGEAASAGAGAGTMSAGLVLRVHCLCLPFLRAAALLRATLRHAGHSRGGLSADEVRAQQLAGEEEASTPQSAEREARALLRLLRLPALEAVLGLSTGGLEEGQRGEWAAQWGADLVMQAWAAAEPAGEGAAARPVALPVPMCSMASAAPFQLLALPRSFHSLFQQLVRERCGVCNSEPQHPALCLLCGTLVCVLDSCCERSLGGRGKVAREGFLHAQRCGAGLGVYLLVRRSTILFIRERGRCFWRSPYLDAHGEEDAGLDRGKPLFLSKERYRQLGMHFEDLVAKASALTASIAFV
ncbi:hypothetical protein CYMTET_28760 [Cymbomonas tetramitiformis]|uniref:E3 ubiquitin-protein ligase n=1 Tax=Cymbomonas tetramitiformis TaxID=36881 RepID=A0AAE0KVK8_9CHLO|nr:hypothetical protein CYMTET_28760 [Cymbomonas tetramitiformis]